MVLDYHDKRNTQRVKERRPVQKNRPKREPAALFIVLGLVAVVLSYGGGVLTGWLVFKPSPGETPVNVAAAPPKKEAPAPQQPPAPPAEPSLTFYKTLPEGSKGAIGSGINLNIPASAVPPPAAKPGVAAGAKVTAAAASAPASAAAEQPTAPAAPPAAKPEPAATYVVQVASYRNKAEADVAQVKLAKRGLPAYVTESRSLENGVWYRLRVGKRLAREEASEMAAKAGKGSVVLPE